MRTIPTPEQIAKLPAWAREHIRHVEMEREMAVRSLNEFCDEQTESSIYVEDHPCIGEGPGPSWKKRYLQTDRVNFVLPRAEHTLEVRVNAEAQIVEVRSPRGFPFIEPTSGNSFNIVPRENDLMRPHPIDVLKAIQDVDKHDKANFVSKHGFAQDEIPAMIKKVIRHL